MVAKTVAQDTQPVIAQKPVKWCSVPLYEVIQSGCRLDAGVYDIEARKAKATILNCKYGWSNLISDSFVRHAYYGSRLKRKYIDKSNKKAKGFVGSSEMLDIYPRPIKFMADTADTACLSVIRDSVLISRSGTIGNVTYVSKTLSNFFVSEHAIRLEGAESPGYVYAYLKSDIGKKLILTCKYGAVIDEIEPEHLETVPIPNAPETIKRRINDLIVRSYNLRDESNTLLDNATALLVSELHLPPVEEFAKADFGYSEKVKAFSVRLCDLNCRFDASYHLPIANAITKHLEKYAQEVTTVGDGRISSDIVLPGRFKRVYVEEGYGRVLFGGKQVSELDPTNKKYISNVKHGSKLDSELSIVPNVTLITRSGTIGKTAIVPQHWTNWIPSDHIIRVFPANSNIAGYLNVFLASEYGEKLITRQTYGSVVDEIDNTHVASIPFPLLKNKEAQKEINDLALQANDLRYQAYLLEQEALKVLNDEVIYAK